jgi:asparagine synthase (glutamine-hydrolysing)
MCGISGIYNISGKKVEVDKLLKMTKIVQHRGPDDEGYLFINSINGEYLNCFHDETVNDVKDKINLIDYSFNANLCFGFRRLSIIDLSAAGHQPMSNPDESIWIVFNGEIYNYIELRAELTRCGFRFNTNTDTEVLIAAYQKWGLQCLNKLNGMFAFAIWDSRINNLMLVRDRFGVKPLYYHFDGDTLVFGSEVKQILAYGVDQNIDEKTILKSFSIGGFIENSGSTFFKGVNYLPAAHFLIFDNNKPQIFKYFDINIETMGKSELSYDEACLRYRELFEDSIKIRMRSDVSVGSTLSGGLDSSAIVCMAGKMSQKKINTFTYYSHEQERFDERNWAKHAINQVDANAFYITKSAKEFLTDFEKITWHHDYPLMGSSHIAQYYVMMLAKQNNTKVLLDGQGSDEISAGYVHSFYRYYADLITEVKFSKFLPEFKSFIQNNTTRSYIDKTLKTSLSLLLNENRLYNLELKLSTNLLNISKTGVEADEFVHHKGISRLNNFLYNQTMHSSVQSLMQTEDRNAMAHSIENREPFLDYRLVELLFTLPASYKINGCQGKRVHRDALKEIIPPAIQNRKDKLGFLAPGEDFWLRNELKPYFIDMLNSGTFKKRGIFNHKKVSSLYEKHLRGDNSCNRKLWGIMALEKWFQTFYDKKL